VQRGSTRRTHLFVFILVPLLDDAQDVGVTPAVEKLDDLADLLSLLLDQSPAPSLGCIR
jgi:hypothetical protein